MNSYKKIDFAFIDLKSVLGFIVFLFVVIHVFLLLQYGTFLPCEAAAWRVVNARYANLPSSKNKAEVFGQAIGKTITENMTFKITYSLMRHKSITYCYAVALNLKESE